MNTPATQPLERVPTKIPGLDTVLKGGLVRSGVYVINGTPGTGKTLMGNQICYHHVKSGGRALYITLLAESHDRILGYLRSMSFFEPSVIPEQIAYVSAYSVLEEKGLEGLMDLIRQEMRRHKATLLVLDGFLITEEFRETELSVKRMIHELQALNTMIGCTSILLTIFDSEKGRVSPGHTMVDGIIELTDTLVGPRAVRELQIKKIRGTDFLRGKHAFDINNNGLVVYPRTEVLLGHPPEVAGENRTRERFGVIPLDKMLGGGLLSGSMTTLLGAPGTGKTLLGVNFLCEGAAKGQNGIYFGFYEPPPRLLEKSTRVSLPIRKYVQAGQVEMIWQPPLEHLLDGLTERLLRSIEEKKASRVFIDGLEGFKSATVYPERIGAYLAALSNELRARNVTGIFSEETDLHKSEIEMPVKELGAVIENVVLLRHVEIKAKLQRLISILKVRESEYDSSIRTFRITNQGILIDEILENAEGLLSGQGRYPSGKNP